MKKKPEILKREICARGNIFALESVHLRFSNGEERIFERVVGSSTRAVLLIPMPDPKTVWLVREYAAGTEQYELVFPKGMVERNEDLLTAANRELREEVGHRAERLDILKETTAIPGYWGSQATIIVARDLIPDALIGDEPEPLEIVPWKLHDIAALIARDDFTEARSIAAIFLLKEFLQNGR